MNRLFTLLARFQTFLHQKALKANSNRHFVQISLNK
nr:MAG TPA: hypothetical protein [Caudoviricetes sp.]